MDLQEFKNVEIKKKLGIDEKKFGKIFTFIDFSNVNKWYADDIRAWEDKILATGSKLAIDIEKLFSFTKVFSSQMRFYYGHDPQNENSSKFLGKTKFVFGENLVFTKPIQQIRHYLQESEKVLTTRQIRRDNDGDFIYLPKCNFDVEICVDAIRLMNKYDTFCIFSSDSDFVSLMKYLKNNRKKIILVKGGHVQYSLKANSDLVISAQDVKINIARITQKSSF